MLKKNYLKKGWKTFWAQKLDQLCFIMLMKIFIISSEMCKLA